VAVVIPAAGGCQDAGMAWSIRRRGLVAAVVGGSLLAADSSTARAGTPPPGIPTGYGDVDPRTARRVPLWQELSPTNPLFPGDPPFSYDIFTTIQEPGYLLERITSLGTHTGTHISAPAHFVPGAPALSQLDESWTLMPLVVLDVRARVAADGGDFQVDLPDLRRFEQRHGPIPAGGCVLLLTGFATHYTPATGPGRTDDYFDPAPGFTQTAVAWLFQARAIKAVGSDTFGPDATSDTNFTATSTTLQHGGITVENVGPGLARMRPFGDWVSINGARPHFSGFQMGITGHTRP
jgi:kynurenine formamidase